MDCRLIISCTVISATAIVLCISGCDRKERRPFVADGFKGYSWGCERYEIAHDIPLKFLIQEKHTTLYEATLPEFGSATIQRTFICFFRDSLSTVTLFASGHDNYERLRLAMTEAYGEPLRPPGDNEKLLFPSGGTIRSLEYNEYSRRVTVFMFSLAMMNREETNLMREAIEAAGDL